MNSGANCCLWLDRFCSQQPLQGCMCGNWQSGKLSWIPALIKVEVRRPAKGREVSHDCGLCYPEELCAVNFFFYMFLLFSVRMVFVGINTSWPDLIHADLMRAWSDWLTWVLTWPVECPALLCVIEKAVRVAESKHNMFRTNIALFLLLMLWGHAFNNTWCESLKCFALFPQNVSSDIYWYYSVQAGFYLALSLSLCTDHKRKVGWWSMQDNVEGGKTADEGWRGEWKRMGGCLHLTRSVSCLPGVLRSGLPVETLVSSVNRLRSGLPLETLVSCVNRPPCGNTGVLCQHAPFRPCGNTGVLCQHWCPVSTGSIQASL